MAEYEVLVIDTSVPEIRAPGAGDSYLFVRSVRFEDDTYAYFGASNDLQIYHEGGLASHVKSVSNDLYITAGYRLYHESAGGGWGTNQTFTTTANITYATTAATFENHNTTWAPTAGAGDFYFLRLLPTINQTGTASGNYTALQVNVTETAVIGSSNYLMDLQVGGVSQFAVTNGGDATAKTLALSDSISSAPPALLTMVNTASTNDYVTQIGCGYPGWYDDQFFMYHNATLWLTVNSSGNPLFHTNLSLGTDVNITSSESGNAQLKLHDPSGNTILGTNATMYLKYQSTNILTLDNTGIDVTGNITVSGNVDGVDISALGTAAAPLWMTINATANWITVDSSQNATFVGDVNISEVAPIIKLLDTTVSAYTGSIAVDNDNFNIQARDNSGTFIAQMHQMGMGASGATSHTFNIGGSAALSIDSSSNATFANQVTLGSLSNLGGPTSLHIGASGYSVGRLAANSSANQLVIESGGVGTGLSILGSADYQSFIMFGNGNSTSAGQIMFDNTTNDMHFYSSGTGGFVFQSDVQILDDLAISGVIDQNGAGTNTFAGDVWSQGAAAAAAGNFLAVQNTGAGVGTSVSLFLAPNTGGGSDLARAAEIRSTQTTSGNYADLKFYIANGTTPDLALTIGTDKTAAFTGSLAQGDAWRDNTSTGMDTVQIGSHSDDIVGLEIRSSGVGTTSVGGIVFSNSASVKPGVIYYDYVDSELRLNNNLIDALSIDTSGIATFAEDINIGGNTGGFYTTDYDGVYGAVSSLLFRKTGGVHTYITVNYEDNAGAKYITTDYAGAFGCNATGDWVILTAPSGTAGTSPTFTQHFTLQNAGTFLLGAHTPTTSSSIGTSVLGNLLLYATTGDNTAKYNSLHGVHFSLEEETLTMMSGASTSDTVATLRVGGGQTSHNAHSQIDFYTGTANVLTGTARARIDVNGIRSYFDLTVDGVIDQNGAGTNNFDAYCNFNTGGKFFADVYVQDASPQIFLQETGSTYAAQLWSVVRDGDAFSIRWNNTTPYLINATVTGTTTMGTVSIFNDFHVTETQITCDENLDCLAGLDVTGNITATGTVSGATSYQTTNSSTRDKYFVWGSDTNYVIGMESGYTYGGLNDYAMTFQMSNNATRGFWWGDAGHSNAQGAMSLTTDGNLTVADGIRVGNGESDTTGPSYPLHVVRSYSNPNSGYFNHYSYNAISGSTALTADRTSYNIYSYTLLTATSGTTSAGSRLIFYGTTGYVDTNNASGTLYTQAGVWGYVRARGAGTKSYNHGVYGYVNCEAGTITDARGGYFYVYDGAAAASSVFGVYARVYKNYNDTTANAYGGYFETEILTGTYSNVYNVASIVDYNGGALGTSYLYYGDFQGSSGTKRGLWLLGDTANQVAGSFTAGGNITAYSDVRLKENIHTIDSALEKVKGLRGVSFDRINKEIGNDRDIGVIAQEVKDIVPEVVSEHDDGYYSVAYGNLVGLLIEAIKEQQVQIDELRRQ